MRRNDDVLSNEEYTRNRIVDYTKQKDAANDLKNQNIMYQQDIDRCETMKNDVANLVYLDPEARISFVKILNDHIDIMHSKI